MELEVCIRPHYCGKCHAGAYLALSVASAVSRDARSAHRYAEFRPHVKQRIRIAADRSAAEIPLVVSLY
jgi:hypothetical protein